MSQQQFSRPGAIDLSAFSPAGNSGPGPEGAAGTRSSYATTANEQNMQTLLEASMSAPVLLVFYSPNQVPASQQLADDFVTLSAEFEGKFLVGLVDVDTAPAIAQAMQIPSVPLVVAVVQGRPAPLLQEIAPLESLRQALTQVMQQFAVQGFTARHQPLRAAGEADDEGSVIDPRYAAAQDALAAGNIDAAVSEYQKLVAANPSDSEASAGLAMAQLLQRTMGVDLTEARAAAAAKPDDIAAQTLVADLDLVGGHVDDAFNRLIELVRRTQDADRNQAREHLLTLFAAVGNEDPRVLRGRQNLASALF
jgi:putative thioredoxin